MRQIIYGAYWIPSKIGFFFLYNIFVCVCTICLTCPKMNQANEHGTKLICSYHTRSSRTDEWFLMSTIFLLFCSHFIYTAKTQKYHFVLTSSKQSKDNKQTKKRMKNAHIHHDLACFCYVISSHKLALASSSTCAQTNVCNYYK